MTSEKTRSIAAAGLFCLVVVGLLSIVASARLRVSTEAEQREVARGKYLVEEVAKCIECHTPRDARGNLDTHAWLQGAPIWIMPVQHIPNWADRAPALAGLPSFTDAEVERVLEKGIGPEGEELRPPMHTYHMSPADAKAIIAYLKSLPVQRH
jgi:mono/diheme cytochrome c family protein